MTDEELRKAHRLALGGPTNVWAIRIINSHLVANATIDALTERLTLAEGALQRIGGGEEADIYDERVHEDGLHRSRGCNYCHREFGKPHAKWCTWDIARSYFSPPTTEGTTND